jgi:hypothetical protein
MRKITHLSYALRCIIILSDNYQSSPYNCLSKES